MIWIVVEPSSVWIISLYNDIDAWSQSTNNIFVRLYDENWLEIDVMHIPWVKHLDEVVSNAEFFTEKVFTKEVLEKIDAYIHPIFNYNSDAGGLDIEEMLENSMED